MKYKEIMKTLVLKKDGFEIYFEALEEFIQLAELLPEENEESLEGISNSNEIFCAKVSAHKCGIELASDYLGGCIYETAEDFYTKHKDDYFEDMVCSVVSDAKKEIKVLLKELKK
jgi:hypothetical protein